MELFATTVYSWVISSSYKGMVFLCVFIQVIDVGVLRIFLAFLKDPMRNKLEYEGQHLCVLV